MRHTGRSGGQRSQGSGLTGKCEQKPKQGEREPLGAQGRGLQPGCAAVQRPGGRGPVAEGAGWSRVAEGEGVRT